MATRDDGMGFIEDYQELLLRPRAHMKKRAGKNSVAQAFLAYLLIAGFSVLAFGLGTGQTLSKLLNIGQFELVAAYAAYVFVLGLLTNFVVPHLIAGALGGKGRISDLFAFVVEYQAPLFFFPLVAFIPCVGGLASLAYVAGLYWILYNVLEELYGLSLKRSIATIVASLVVSGVLTLIIIGAFFLLGASSMLASNASAPIITQTATGHHYYSQLQGGYSFDYPAPLETVDFGKMTNESTLGKLLQAMMSNNQFGTVMLTGSGSGATTIMFSPDLGSDEIDFSDSQMCNADLVDAMASRQGVKYDVGEATATPWNMGPNKVCVITGIKNRSDGKSMNVMAGNCGKKNGFFAGVAPENYATLEEIAMTIRCGANATK